MPPIPTSAILGAVAAFFGGAGLIAALGFLVQQALFMMLGVPIPPFAAIDYLRVAGYFLFDFIVVVVLLSGVLWGVVPGLWILIAFSIGVALLPRPVRTRVQFAKRYRYAWIWITRRWQNWLAGRVGLLVCLALLVIFTFAYHYPVFAQRAIGIGSATGETDPGCPTPAPVNIVWRPLRFGWDAVQARCAFVRAVVLKESELGTAQEIYTNGALWLLLFAMYLGFHPYSQLAPAGRRESAGRRWLWAVNAILVAVSIPYLPSGYGVLFREKQAPQVSFAFKDESKTPAVVPAATAAPAAPSTAETWREKLMYRTWYLVFQNEREVWLYRAPHVVVLQKDQLAGLEIRDRHWIFE